MRYRQMNKIEMADLTGTEIQKRMKESAKTSHPQPGTCMADVPSPRKAREPSDVPPENCKNEVLQKDKEECANSAGVGPEIQNSQRTVSNASSMLLCSVFVDIQVLDNVRLWRFRFYTLFTEK